MNRATGGGVLLDLCVHLMNITNLLGYSISSVKNAVLSAVQVGPAGYKPIERGDIVTVEDHASLQGVMQQNVLFNFAVGKYAQQAERYLEFTASDGSRLRTTFNAQNTTQLFNPAGELTGTMSLKVDPYLLTILHAIKHLRSGSTFPMFYPEQRDSVLWIDKIQTIGRS